MHGINIMPVTPITELLMRPAYVAEEYPIVAEALETATDEWKSIVVLDHAIVDPANAWDEIAQIQTFDAGNSRSNALYWIATRPDPGLNLTAIAAAAGAVHRAEEKGKGSGPSVKCDDNPECQGLGLSGDCCPTDAGILLGCCG